MLTTWLDRTRHDIRYTLRGLRRSPGFTATVMLTLGLGVGANAAMFGLLGRLMFRPFAYMRDPGTVSRVYLQAGSRRVVTSAIYPYTRYLDLRRWTTSFSQYAGFAEWPLAVGVGEDARERTVVGISAAFFDFFDARPVIGRFFNASEDSIPRGANVVVVGYGFWKTELGGKNVLGQALQVGPLRTTIIGVAPRGFVGVEEGEPPAVFMPITAFAFGLNQGDARSFYQNYHWDWMSVLVRRKPGVTRTQASADLTHAFVQSFDAQRLQDSWVAPATIARPRAIAGAVRSAAGPDAGLESQTLLWVTGVAAIVLLIACANVANLLFSRTHNRRREIAVRLALGVSRRRLAAQLLTEGAVLAILGGLAGLAVAALVSMALGQLLVESPAIAGLSWPPRHAWSSSSIAALTDWHTLATAGGLALVAGILTSIGPSLLAGRGDLTVSLRAGVREGTRQRSRLRSALLIVQGALSVVLLVGAGLFVRSLDNVRAVRLGWDPEPVLIVDPNLRGLALDTAAATALRHRLLETAQSIPGVEYAARVDALPFATSTWHLHVEGIDSVARLGRFNFQAATPDYFKVVGTRIVRGRSFTASDRGPAARVVVVSESMARVLWPGKDAIGQCLRVGADTLPCTRVIGIAEDAVQYSISDNERLMYYVPDEEPPPVRPGRRLFLRMRGPSVASSIERVRRALQRAMPAPGYVTVVPLEDLVDAQRRSWRVGAGMFVAFGALALVVAAVGLYGVIAYDVAQRKHELGVRIALGAMAHDVVRLVVAEGLSLAAAGVAIGLGVSLIAAHWVQPLLFRESGNDPVVLVIVGLAMGVVAVIASAAPAMRAARADPITALRSD